MLPNLPNPGIVNVTSVQLGISYILMSLEFFQEIHLPRIQWSFFGESWYNLIFYCLLCFLRVSVNEVPPRAGLPTHCSLLIILIGKQHFLSNIVQVQLAMCSASFPLCFSSPTRTGLVSPIPEWNLVILRRHSSFAVCFQASTLSNFLRHRCHHTSTTPVSMPPTYPETTIHPSQWAAPIRRAVLCCLISTCVLRIWGTLLLARFLLPFIFSISNYLCPDRLF